MKILSVNVSRVTQVLHGGELVSTGIFKRPVEGAVHVGTTQVAGDQQADRKHHGGPDKAVYGYPWEHYATWAAEMDRDLFAPGQFGENLTTEGLLETQLCIGDRIRVGTVVLEVSQPRIPCFKLGITMKSKTFPKHLLKSGRVGFYFRVLEPGVVRAGDAITVEPSAHERVSVREVSQVRFFDNGNRDAIERILCNPALADVWRQDFEELLGSRR